jgi:hypothetical protein
MAIPKTNSSRSHRWGTAMTSASHSCSYRFR